MLDKTTFEKVLGELDYFSKTYYSIPLRAVFESAGINKELPYDKLMKILDAFVEKHPEFSIGRITPTDNTYGYSMIDALYVATNLSLIPKTTYICTECCPYCENEEHFIHNPLTQGYSVVCPSCGKKILLCSECLSSEDCPNCNYHRSSDGTEHCHRLNC